LRLIINLLLLLVSFHRIIKESLTLSDGLVLPRGTHICFAAGPMGKDPAYVSDPDIFNGFRWCQYPEDRHALVSDPSEKQLLNSCTSHDSSSAPTSFVTISPASMHFGFGHQACPGRFFAVNTIKAIMSYIILEYDFKFEECQAGKRPPNIIVGEHIIPSTSTNVLFKKRSVGL
jgi:cytochrome P450 monooxygenase